MWMPDGVHGQLLRGVRGRVAVVVGEEIPEMGLFRVEIQLEVDDGRVVGGGTGVVVVEHWEEVKWTRGGEPRLHGIA